MLRPRSTSTHLKIEEDRGTNATENPTIGEVIAARLSRRDLGKGLLAASVVQMLLANNSTVAEATPAPDGATRAFDFAELDAGSDGTHHVAEGYDADVLIRWGDRVIAGAPDFAPMNQTSANQAQQFGYNNDFIGYLPIDGKSDHGLLVVNHEYTIEELMFPGIGRQDKDANFAATMPNLVEIEMMAHGGSVIEIKREAGKWRVVPDSKYARRITAKTEMRISGPAAGHAKMRTNADPAGTRVFGMVNNCAGATTPWGTWLTCEENINGYFWNKSALSAHPDAAALKRYGIPQEAYAWGKFDTRFDIGAEPNEAHRFGWVVEIDPFDPQSVPVKRTALGRFKHEGAGNVINKDGRFVVYQGDDERFDYVYKFVTGGKVDQGNSKTNKDLLDTGTLYVARFSADGRGHWLPLVHGQGPLTPALGFADQGTVVIFARQASDMLGATKMDRPEDIEVNPKTNKVYVMLTNNSKRSASDVDAANPRPENKFGHIIEITPDDDDHAALTFSWEILVKCGDPAVAAVGATFNPLTSANGWFGMPDNCAVDALGRLWVATDGNSGHRTGRNDGIWAIETEGTARGTSKLFFRVPVGAEMCGPCFTPDLETFFVAVQHPGEVDEDDPNAPPATFENPSTRWPDFKEGMPPRPSVVAITRKGGGKIAV